MIRAESNVFLLDTAQTTYAFHLLPSGHLEHLYYGSQLILRKDDPFTETQAVSLIEALSQKTTFLPGNTIAYSEDFPCIGLENLCLELSSLGKGDLREPFLQVTLADGSTTSDFIYKSHAIRSGKSEYVGLPSSYGTEETVSTLTLTLKDNNSPLTLELLYHVYEESNVISRSARLINTGETTITIERLMSFQLDLADSNYLMTTFNGAWGREMAKSSTPCQAGTLVNSSLSGSSSSRSNPFYMIHRPETSESFGECFGFNLVYSGNHYSAVAVSAFNKLRIVGGIHPTTFQYPLSSGEVFQTPEAVLTYSSAGFTGVSHNMHHFIREHIVRGTWQHKERPILLNSWEAAYFKFDQAKLLKLAKKAADVGIELFVLDDGWFGKRNDDTSSLGDWEVNLKKLPQGLGGLAKKINALGMAFGIWVEPEMVNEDSDCYRKHPEWAVKIPGKAHSLGRNQMFLDLTQTEVQDYIIQSMTQVFSSGPIDYVKWDMNRNLSDAFSANLAPKEQGAFNHRYMLGLYKVLETLVQRFPHILFESCASGGNRFDLGMLCYMPQIWASDNTDAISRLDIQDSYSYGYPTSVLGAHVSDCPNHQTLRQVPIETRYQVACFGLLGYECNLTDFSEKDLQVIAAHIQTYKTWRPVFQFGDHYRLSNPLLNKGTSWTMVSKDQKRAVAGLFQKQVQANTMDLTFKGKGLSPQSMYKFYNLPFKHNIKKFGDLINLATPVHIKNQSTVQHLVSLFYELDGETEHHTVSGSVITQAGIRLKQGFAGMGYNENIRLYQDYDSRVYYMEEV